MANADFSKQNPAQGGGFGEGSYRQAKRAEPERRLTPAQQKAAAFEKKLPAALKTRAAAGALCAVMALAAVFGIGGAKLSARYTAAARAFTEGVPADNGYAMAEELTARANNAANILTTAQNTAGVNAQYLEQVQSALETYLQRLDAQDVAGLYDANTALTAAVDQLYAELQALASDPMNMGAVQAQYSEFNSAGVVLNSLAYNETAQEYNDMAAGFPANLIGALWNAEEVALFK